MKKTITKLMAALALLLFVAPPLVGWGQTTETLNIGTYASAHNWNNGTAYYDASTDNVTFTGSGTGNNCKYYTSDNSWRYYSSGNGQITIACPDNNYITNITLSGTSFFTTAPDGWNYANNVFTPQEETQVNSVTIANGGGTSKITSIAVTYISSTPATVAVPTFNPVAGTYTEAQSVIISCETDGAAIYYTLDGTTPDNNSANYTDAINITETTTIKAIAYIGEDASSVATAIYTIISFEHQGTAEDPYSVADAHTAIDANIGTTGVYATGIVSAIPTAYNSNYGNVTFDIVDEEGDEVYLRAYRCGGDEAANVAVGDVVVVSGNLTKYNEIYEFGSGCQVVSLEHPTVTEPTITLSDSGTLNIGNYPVGGEITRTFTVEQNNLTEGITLTATNGGSLNPESIEQGAEVTEVTWTFTPTEAGQFSSTITATSGQTTAQFTYMGYAKTVHNVMIDQNIVNGEVSAEPTTGIEGDYITLYVTPAEGYELEALTIVDANNAPINYTDFETYYRFQMPDSDVTVNATFVDAGATTTVTDVLTNSNTIGSTTTSYSAWTATGISGVSYSGQSAGSNGTIQFRSNNDNSGLVSTTTVGKINKVVVAWNSNTVDGRTLNVYGSNTAYSEPSDLYSDNSGTLLGTIVKGTSTSLTITGNYAYVGLRSASGAMYLEEIDIVWEVNGPSISAEDYEITFDTDADELEYTINNPVEGGVLTVATTSDWLMVDEDPIQIAIAENYGSIEFLCDTNFTPEPRTALVTFTYAYGDNQTVTRDITVTQEANPEAFHHISDITEVGHAYHVKGQVLATSSRGFVIGDSTAYVYTYMDNTSFDYAVGDEVAILGTTGSYGHVIQFTSQATIETTTDVEYNGQPYPEVITAVPDYSEGYHLSTYFEFEGVLVKPTSNYYVRLSATDSICISYPTETQQTAYNNMLNKNVHVYGFFAGISSSTGFTVIVESLAEAVHYAINVTPDSIDLESNEAANGALEVTYQNFDASQIHDAFPIFYTPDGNGGYIPFGEEEDDLDWISFTYAAQFDTIYYTVQANDTDEARTAYFQYTVDPTFNPGAYIYSNMITISQPAYVAPTSSTGTITFGNEGTPINSGTTTGLDNLNNEWTITVEGNNPYISNSSSYAQVGSSNKPATSITFTMTLPQEVNITAFEAKFGGFNGTAGDITLKVGEATVGSGSLNASNDVTVTNTTQATGTTLTVTVTNISKGVKCYYISYTYENGEPQPSITVNPNLVNALAEGGDGTLSIILSNMTISTDTQLDVVYCYENGELITNLDDMPNWLECIITEDNEDYVVYYSIGQSTNPEEQTAYFKVYGLDDDGTTEAYSNLVTINQAGAPQQYTLTVEPFENLELITFVNDEMVMEADGEIQVNEGDHIMLSIVADEGYDMETLMVNGVNHVNDIADDFTYEFDMPAEAVTISATAIEHVVPTPGEWVMVSLNDLTENDVFVIVGTRYDDNYAGNYAMPNNNGDSAPGAVAITINGEALAEEPAANLQWNISRTGNSYTFYPNGDTENWLYCTNANNGIKVGVGSAHHFTLSDNGYLTTTETTVQRYLGIYNSQDWRCYTSEGGNIANQTFAFYKKNVSTQTYNLTINGYGQSEGGYRLIASPVYVNPDNVEGMTEGDFDLYYFDQSEVGFEWRNFEEEGGQFNLVPGKGYLYANNTDVELTFTGIPYSGDGIISLVKDDNAAWAGWNLVGNPFGTTAYLDRNFYVMNEAGTEILSDACTGAVEAMQGVFVIAEEVGENLTFSNQAPEPAANVTLNLTQSRGAVIDRTVVRFGEGRQLPKFQLNTESTKLYIPQSNNDYAVVRSAAQGEMPVNFKASKNGSYTLAIDAENVEMNYLHLIDNMTGADVDLLATPIYTFDAKTTDYASRFKLVFSANANENDDENETFAFFNGSEWCISNTGEATLQVVDMLGRIVSSESVNGNATLSTDNLMSGVYMFRLVNGENVKVQKVVVK